MLTLSNQILEENPRILLRYQKQFPFVLTDESQDTSIIQNKIIEKVTQLSDNLFVVGDDDQSIRSFEYGYQQLDYIIKELKKKELIGQTAILYRNNISAINLIDHLESANLVFYVRDSGYKFFNHWVIKDILNFMRFSYSDKNVGILETIYTKFNSYISKQQIEYLKNQDPTKSVFDHLAELPNLPVFRKKNFQELKRQFKKLNAMNPIDALRYIRK